MTPSQLHKRNVLSIQQLLFGYDRGHTLLAASSVKAKNISSALLAESDWDPRTVSGVDSYLSGHSVGDNKIFALMKTWRAPEMPRPGCVWTHVLLIDNADLSRMNNLTGLEKLLRRPKAIENYGAYTEALDVDLESLRESGSILDPVAVSDLVHRAYLGQTSSSQFPDDADNLAAGMLALWSQQWPALRRKYSFRTAPLSSKRSASKTEYDLEIDGFEDLEDQLKSGWQLDASQHLIQDLLEESQSTLRRFLWRYGADTSNDPRNMLNLTYIYQELVLKKLREVPIANIVDQIGEWYAQPNDAALLKLDLVCSTEAEFSLLPQLDQFEVVYAVRSSQLSAAFPEPGPVTKNTVDTWVRNRATETRDMLCDAADDQSCFIESLFAGLSGRKHSDFIWSLLSKSKSAFLRASRFSIEHLVDRRLDRIEDGTLLELLKSVRSSPSTIRNMLPFLLGREDTGLITFVNDTVSASATELVINYLADGKLDEGRDVSQNWVEYVKNQPDQVALFAKEAVKRRSQLLVCRYLLDADVTQYPLDIWARRLNHIESDLSSHDDLEFRVFLLIQSLRAPEDGAVTLLKDTFDPVYFALAQRLLSFRTEMQLAEYLPHIGWLNNWDKCLRLKIATVAVCKALSLAKRDVMAISKDDHHRVELGELWSG